MAEGLLEYSRTITLSPEEYQHMVYEVRREFPLFYRVSLSDEDLRALAELLFGNIKVTKRGQ
ncbi:MAG: hypothetical protein FWF81_11105 [Defluviitaleaceae bacterium]|nr:hypothetical protein [Defluviitaleaceae bacterium]